MKKATCLTVLVFMLATATALAAVPSTLSYQGLLKDAGGSIVPDDNYTLIFAIYAAPGGGTALWTETQVLPVSDGVFNAILGSVTAIPVIFDDTFYLGVAIDPDPELTPRIEFTSAASAINADRLDGLHAAAFAPASHAHSLNSLSDVAAPSPADGEVLTYESGSGAWTSSAVPASTDGDWVINGSNLYSGVSGNVGIGTSAPGTKLQVENDINGSVGLKIRNPNTGSNSTERISFSDENGDIAYIALYDEGNASYGGQMKIANNRPGGKIHVSNQSGSINLHSNGNVGIGTSVPAQKLDVAGVAEVDGLKLTAGAASGKVLTSDASGNATWQSPAAADDGDWIIAGDDVYRNTGGVGIGGAPYRPAPDTSKGDIGIYDRVPASTKLFVAAENQGIYSQMTETDTVTDDRAAVYGYRTRTTRNDGTGYSAGQANAGVIGQNFWGDNYTFGVAGYNYNDYGHSAGVMGAQWNGSYWGALGYKDENSATWGLYTPSTSYLGGDVTVAGKIRQNGAFGNGYGGTAIVAENTSSGGIAVWAETWGTDATVVIDQNGTGDMMRGFDSGSLKFRVTGTGTVVTPVLQITGGSDLAEPFAMVDEQNIPEGALVVIDDENPGQLKLSDSEYDFRVAGVVSGAGGVNPGLTLNQEGTFAGGKNVALSGRVYAMADVTNGPIRAGDLLTTSSKPGHAMRATDRDRAHGAVIGKAMSTLDDGTGLVLVLVNLQ